MKSYQDINKNDIEAKSFNILIITATEMETKAFHEVMADPVMRVICGDYTYYVGQVGLYNIIHVQCLQMGSLNPGGSSQTVNTALQEWSHIKAVMMVGICFGFDDKKQQIGDIVISSAIRNYETRRMGATEEIPRGSTYQTDKCLLNAFNNLKLSWENIGIDNQTKNMTLGLYISGEQLVDNKTVRNRLLSESPEAKAGEMEGNGLVAACESARKPWILVKAICDFADGNKGKDKNKRQAIAAASSANCCAAVLEQATAFEAIGVSSVSGRQLSSHPCNINEEHFDVLFEIYKKDYELFYVKRAIDKTVESYLESQSLWIHGLSGVGKSTAILHALNRMGKPILLVNMASISPNSTLVEIFEWIYFEVAAIVGENSIAPPSYQLCIRRIISLLDSYYTGQEVYVLVEEIPFTGDSFKDFVSSFSSLVVSDALIGQSAKVHFVLSSIENPLPHVPIFQQKVKSIVKFLEFDRWAEDECIRLIELIKQNITTPDIKDIGDFINQCGYLPRPIKGFFRESHQIGIDGEVDSLKVRTLLARL